MKLGISHKRLAVLVAIGLVLIGGGWAYVHFSFSRPVGEGPAGPAVPRDAFQKPWTERPVLLVGLGDSIVAGLGASRLERSFFNRMIANPKDEFPEMRGVGLAAVLPNLRHENLAISGTTSIQHAQVVEERLQPQDSDMFGLVVMTTGGNDLIHSYGQRPPREGAMYGASLEQARPWIRNYEERLGAMLDDITARFPGGCEIYLGDIYDPTDGVGDAPSVFLPHWPDGLLIHAEYNRAIERVAARRPNVFVVPLYQTFLGHGSHCRQFWRETYAASDPHYWFFTNIEDPNDRGYDAIRRAFLVAMVEHSRLRASSEASAGKTLPAKET